MTRSMLAILVFLAAAGCSGESESSQAPLTEAAQEPEHHALLVEIHETISTGEGVPIASQHHMYADSAEFQPDGSLLLTGLSFRRPEDSSDEPAATGDSARFWFEGDQPHADLDGVHIKVTDEYLEGETPKGLLLISDFLSSQPGHESGEAINE